MKEALKEGNRPWGAIMPKQRMRLPAVAWGWAVPSRREKNTGNFITKVVKRWDEKKGDIHTITKRTQSVAECGELPLYLKEKEKMILTQ